MGNIGIHDITCRAHDESISRPLSKSLQKDLSQLKLDRKKAARSDE